MLLVLTGSDLRLLGMLHEIVETHGGEVDLRSAGAPSLHGMRHTGGAAREGAGCSPHEIAGVLGHRTLQMVERYTKQARHQRLAGSAIEKLAKNKNETR